MTYSVKEIFYTLQGEGIYAGRPAIFCRFAGCNLWSGRAQDRLSAQCTFCDTDFIGTDGENGGKYVDAQSLVQRIISLCPNAFSQPMVVLTGGEPMLQIDDELIDTLHQANFYVAIETNGTLAVHPKIDWVCVSPKANTSLVIHQGHELKVVVPQDNQPLEDYLSLDFKHFLLQPMDDPHYQSNLQYAIEYCKEHPQWRLSLQTHKYLNIP